jgi:DME family drug/metabolite transporter
MTQGNTHKPPVYTHSQGLIFVFAAGVLWSTVGLGIRLIQSAEVWQILLYRSFSLAIFLFFVIRIRSGENPFRQVQRTGLPAVIAALALVAAYSGAIFAIQTTSVANAMLLFASAPFLTAILGLIFLRESVRSATWIAILVAVIGIGIMVADKSSGSAVIGSLAALGSALGFAIFTVALRWGKAGDMLPAVFLSGVLGVLITTMVCFGLGLSFVLSLNDGGIAMGMGVFQVGAGLILYTLGSKTLPAAELTLLSLAEVLLGPVWVWLVLGETTTLNTLIGGCLLLTAIVGNAISSARQKSRAPVVAFHQSFAK